MHPVLPLALVALLACVSAARGEEPCAVDVEGALRRLLSSEQPATLQVRALRRDLVRKLLTALDALDRETDDGASSWRNGLPGPAKRNLEALARAGHLRTRADLQAADDEAEEEEEEVKRSIANLAKAGQLPVLQRPDGKRGIQSLARNGELHGKRQPKRESRLQQLPAEYDYDQEAARELYGKRNIASLARNYELPYHAQGNEKRFLGSLARTGDLARFYAASDKRNVASLAREGGAWTRGKRAPLALLVDAHAYPVVDNRLAEDTERAADDKRNIASIKAQYKPKFRRSVVAEEAEGAARQKREVSNEWPEDASDEFLSPVFQNGRIPTLYDYEELLRELEQAQREAERAPDVDKRFLGSVARSGWFRSPNSGSTRYRAPDKRHIGALARLGWLPSLRNTRRFNRSGREVAYDGQTEDYGFPQAPPRIEDSKRFLLQPAVDQILLKKVFIHPRSH